MNDVGIVLLSVRAEARQLVAADYAVMDGMIEHTAGSKAEAVRSVASALDRLTAELGAFGGVPFDQTAQRRPLTWSAHSSSTREERYHDKETRRVELTGQVTATVTLRVTVRDLDVLDALSAVLAARQDLHVHSVTWHVDWDNPAWAQVRAAAIRTAIGKARDYAAALGATVQEVEHVADAGLLGGDAAGYDLRKVPQVARAASGSANAGEPGTPALNPVPLELVATIDARVRSTGASLPET